MAKRLGCLILHGLTSSLDCVNGLEPYMKRNGIPYRMPVLRGHMTKPEDLIGVTWRDWYADGEAALLDLCKEVDQVVVVGLSMGGLVALQTAMDQAGKVDSLVTVAAALRMRNPLATGNPLAFAQPIVQRVLKYVAMKPVYADPTLCQYDTNYPKVPSDAAVSFLQYGALIEKRLAEVKAPILIIQSHQDHLVKPESAQVIYDGVSSAEKRILWLDQSKHEMMRDVQREDVFKAVEAFVLEREKVA
jgi:carboxylesterase